MNSVNPSLSNYFEPSKFSFSCKPITNISLNDPWKWRVNLLGRFCQHHVHDYVYNYDIMAPWMFEKMLVNPVILRMLTCHKGCFQWLYCQIFHVSQQTCSNILLAFEINPCALNGLETQTNHAISISIHL